MVWHRKGFHYGSVAIGAGCSIWETQSHTKGCHCIVHVLTIVNAVEYSLQKV